jgi:hypothetical protein
LPRPRSTSFEQPADGFGEAGDFLLLLAAADHGARADQAGDGFGGVADALVVAGQQEFAVDAADLAVAVVHALDAQLPAFGLVVVLGDQLDAGRQGGGEAGGAVAGGGFVIEVERDVVASSVCSSSPSA